MLKRYKNLFKFFALSSVLTGCVMRTPTTYHEDTVRKLPNGKEEKVQYTYSQYDLQFTSVGNVWNGGCYGVMGGIFTPYIKAKEEFCNTNTTSAIKKTGSGMGQFILGIPTGIYYGAKHGYNLKYKDGSSLEGALMDATEVKVKQLQKFMENPWNSL